MAIAQTLLSWLPDIIGLVGVALVLIAYVLLQIGRLSARMPSYSLMNALGSGAILFSLFFRFNLSAALIEGTWLLVSVYGLARAIRRRRVTPAIDRGP